eukprot:TRINITY_DN120678_c0_g1_i1.p1 TRINITY_DN120678_c0_g1~~TRINITY_DN120678_c0_g1_i1.p1  ORF type:complete len:1401 (+),score=488.53 TRINITY_DN120678_c0_g1_i1:115-4203(+)
MAPGPACRRRRARGSNWQQLLTAGVTFWVAAAVRIDEDATAEVHVDPPSLDALLPAEDRLQNGPTLPAPRDEGEQPWKEPQAADAAVALPGSIEVPDAAQWKSNFPTKDEVAKAAEQEVQGIRNAVAENLHETREQDAQAMQKIRFQTSDEAKKAAVAAGQEADAVMKTAEQEVDGIKHSSKDEVERSKEEFNEAINKLSGAKDKLHNQKLEAQSELRHDEVNGEMQVRAATNDAKHTSTMLAAAEAKAALDIRRTTLEARKKLKAARYATEEMTQKATWAAQEAEQVRDITFKEESAVRAKANKDVRSAQKTTQAEKFDTARAADELMHAKEASTQMVQDAREKDLAEARRRVSEVHTWKQKEHEALVQNSVTKAAASRYVSNEKSAAAKTVGAYEASVAKEAKDATAAEVGTERLKRQAQVELRLVREADARMLRRNHQLSLNETERATAAEAMGRKQVSAVRMNALSEVKEARLEEVTEVKHLKDVVASQAQRADLESEAAMKRFREVQSEAARDIEQERKRDQKEIDEYKEEMQLNNTRGKQTISKTGQRIQQLKFHASKDVTEARAAAAEQIRGAKKGIYMAAMKAAVDDHAAKEAQVVAAQEAKQEAAQDEDVINAYGARARAMDNKAHDAMESNADFRSSAAAAATKAIRREKFEHGRLVREAKDSIMQEQVRLSAEEGQLRKAEFSAQQQAWEEQQKSHHDEQQARRSAEVKLRQQAQTLLQQSDEEAASAKKMAKDDVMKLGEERAAAWQQVRQKERRIRSKDMQVQERCNEKVQVLRGEGLQQVKEEREKMDRDISKLRSEAAAKKTEIAKQQDDAITRANNLATEERTQAKEKHDQNVRETKETYKWQSDHHAESSERATTLEMSRLRHASAARLAEVGEEGEKAYQRVKANVVHAERELLHAKFGARKAKNSRQSEQTLARHDLEGTSEHYKATIDTTATKLSQSAEDAADRIKKTGQLSNREIRRAVDATNEAEQAELHAELRSRNMENRARRNVRVARDEKEGAARSLKLKASTAEFQLMGAAAARSAQQAAEERASREVQGLQEELQSAHQRMLAADKHREETVLRLSKALKDSEWHAAERVHEVKNEEKRKVSEGVKTARSAIDASRAAQVRMEQQEEAKVHKAHSNAWQQEAEQKERMRKATDDIVRHTKASAKEAIALAYQQEKVSREKLSEELDALSEVQSKARHEVHQAGAETAKNLQDANIAAQEHVDDAFHEGHRSQMRAWQTSSEEGRLFVDEAKKRSAADQKRARQLAMQEREEFGRKVMKRVRSDSQAVEQGIKTVHKAELHTVLAVRAAEKVREHAEKTSEEEQQKAREQVLQAKEVARASREQAEALRNAAPVQK